MAGAYIFLYLVHALGLNSSYMQQMTWKNVELNAHLNANHYH